jgi:hypothetical protein
MSDQLREALDHIAHLGSSVPPGMMPESFFHLQMNEAIRTAAVALAAAPTPVIVDDEPCSRCGVWRRFHVQGPEYSRDHGWLAAAPTPAIDRATLRAQIIESANKPSYAASNELHSFSLCLGCVLDIIDRAALDASPAPRPAAQQTTTADDDAWLTGKTQTRQTPAWDSPAPREETTP